MTKIIPSPSRSPDAPAESRQLTATGLTHDEPPAATVCCVLLNWNGGRDTVACVHALEGQDYPGLTVLVVDNLSTDDSVDRIRTACPGVEIISSPVNGGFSRGCNLGIEVALARGIDLVWLLNNDTVAPPVTLTRLVAAAQLTPGAGIVGTVLHYLHDPARVQAWGGGRLRRWLGYVQHYDRPTPLGEESFLTFASVLIRAQVFHQVGRLDERFFMYFEDADFCIRARRAGWTLTVAPDTAVLHKEGGSVASRRSLLIDRIVTASGLRFLRLHAPVPPISMAAFLLLKVGNRLVHGDLQGLRGVLLGIADWWTGQVAPWQQARP